MDKKKKKFVIDVKNMGVNIDKNEYREIVLSNSSHPEVIKQNKKRAISVSAVIFVFVLLALLFFLVVPPIINTFKQGSHDASLKKAVSMLNSAINLNSGMEGDTPGNAASLYKYLQRHMAVERSGKTDWYTADVIDGETVYSRNLAFYTTDGIRFEFPTKGTRPLKLYDYGDVIGGIQEMPEGPGYCGSKGLNSSSENKENFPCIIVVDVNGDKEPSPYYNKEDSKTEGFNYPIARYQYETPDGTNKNKMGDVYTFLITDNEVRPYGIAAQKVFYKGRK